MTKKFLSREYEKMNHLGKLAGKFSKAVKEIDATISTENFFLFFN